MGFCLGFLVDTVGNFINLKLQTQKISGSFYVLSSIWNTSDFMTSFATKNFAEFLAQDEPSPYDLSEYLDLLFILREVFKTSINQFFHLEWG